MTGEITEEKITETAQKIAREFQPEKIILFGSWAWGKPGPDSDVDLLVVKKSAQSRVERERELQDILFPRLTPLDVLVYTPEELEKSINDDHNLFLEDVVCNGKVLYAKPGSKIRIDHKRRLSILER